MLRQHAAVALALLVIGNAYVFWWPCVHNQITLCMYYLAKRYAVTNLNDVNYVTRRLNVRPCVELLKIMLGGR